MRIILSAAMLRNLQMDAIRRVVTLPLRRPELLKSYGCAPPPLVASSPCSRS